MVLVESGSKDSGEEPPTRRATSSSGASPQPPPTGWMELAYPSSVGGPRELRPKTPGTSTTGVMGCAEAHSVLHRASLNVSNLAGLAVDADALALARQAIDHMEREQLQFVDSVVRVWETYEGSKEFISSQCKEIEAARQELFEPRSELEERLMELQAWEQRAAEDEVKQGSLKASTNAAAAAAKTASDSAEAARAMADHLQRQLMAQKEAHEQELAQLEAERVTKEDEHLSILGAAKDRLLDQRELLGQYQDQLNELW
jgi:hypothetical protein